MRTAVFPGCFDPVTLGHLDIIIRCTHLFDEVHVCILENQKKSGHLFTLEQRLRFLRGETEGMENVSIHSYDGLVTDYAREVPGAVLIRGLRAVTDFDYEFPMALINKKLNPGVETMFMVADDKYTFLSSSMVRELAHYGAKLSCFVPPNVETAIKGMQF